MEERRFDDLTRVLGAATSRRQILKGVISGVLAIVVGRSARPSAAEAAPADVCDPLACEKAAVSDWQNCDTSCKTNLCHKIRPFGAPNLCLGCLTTCLINYEIAAHECRVSGCSGGQQCCSANCVDLRYDANNCGACGNVCPKGAYCSGSECQCADDETVCDGTCTDTDTDPNHCGNCDTTCDTCEHCVGGTCAPIQCNGDEVCCQNQCIAACPNGFLPDPTTCQCNPCLGDGTDGNSCGTNEICCGQQCVSNQCPQGMEYQLSSCSCICSTVTCQPNAHQDPTTCQCVCDPITCDPGEVQDPDTCQCVASCANVTCDTCQTCDSSTGACVSVADNTDCGGGNVCCNGTCQADCTCAGLSCSNGDCCANDTDFACCDDGCCPQVVIQGGAGKGAFCLAPGSETLPGEGITAGNCCQPDKLMKLSVIDPTTTECACDEPDDNLGVYCDGNMPTEYFGSTPCSCGPWFPS